MKLSPRKVSPFRGFVADSYAEVPTTVETFSCFVIAWMEQFLCSARYWLAEYIAAVNLRIRLRLVLLLSDDSLAVKADEENGWMKSDTLARILGRWAAGTPRDSLVNG